MTDRLDFEKARCMKCGAAEPSVQYHGWRGLDAQGGTQVFLRLCSRTRAEHFCLTCSTCYFTDVARDLDTGALIAPLHPDPGPAEDVR